MPDGLARGGFGRPFSVRRAGFETLGKKDGAEHPGSAPIRV